MTAPLRDLWEKGSEVEKNRVGQKDQGLEDCLGLVLVRQTRRCPHPRYRRRVPGSSTGAEGPDSAKGEVSVVVAVVVSVEAAVGVSVGKMATVSVVGSVSELMAA